MALAGSDPVMMLYGPGVLERLGFGVLTKNNFPQSRPPERFSPRQIWGSSEKKGRWVSCSMRCLQCRDIDLYEVNEAFASVPLGESHFGVLFSGHCLRITVWGCFPGWAKHIGADLEKLNVNGILFLVFFRFRINVICPHRRGDGPRVIISFHANSADPVCDASTSHPLVCTPFLFVFFSFYSL